MGKMVPFGRTIVRTFECGPVFIVCVEVTPVLDADKIVSEYSKNKNLLE